MYLLTSGAIQLTKSDALGEKSVVVKTIAPGEIFAEVILFESDRYPVSATAISKAHVFAFEKRRFLDLLDSKDFRDEFILILLRKQRYLTERLHSMLTMDVEQKLRFFLQEHYGKKEKIVPGISKKDFAAAIDTTPETLSRLLLKLKQEKLLAWEEGMITVAPRFWRI